MAPARSEELRETDSRSAVEGVHPVGIELVDDFSGTQLTVTQAGTRMITPMLFVIIALATTDLLFALESIPAIYGLTQEPYLVFTANVFALMGLRQRFFLTGGLLRKLIYQFLGLSVILAFIGVKLILPALHSHLADWSPFGGEIPIWLSLTVVIATLLLTAAASLLKSRWDEHRPRHVDTADPRVSVVGERR